MNAIIESYFQGVSIRKINTVVSHLGINQLSAYNVSNVGRGLDTKVQEFMEKTLNSYYPHVFVDASYFKVRDETQYVSNGPLVGVGIRIDGHLEVMGTRIDDVEYELTWDGMLPNLK